MPTNPPGRADATVVYLGLGSNLGDRQAMLAGAIDRLVERGILTRLCVSPPYETDAVASEPQPPYLNAVVRGETSLPPHPLLAACMSIEADLGRVRPPRQLKAARTLDIDLLLYGTRILDGSGLTVPHPALLHRPFVLIPLADVATADLVHPVTGLSLVVAPPSAGVRRDRWLVPPRYGG